MVQYGYGVITRGGIFGNGKLSGSSSTRPVQVSGLNNITHVALGWSHAVALSDDGTVRAWGDNIKSQVGNGMSISNVLMPVIIISGNSLDITSQLRPLPPNPTLRTAMTRLRLRYHCRIPAIM